MAYGKRFDEWDRASLVAALIWSDPQGYRKPREPASFNPFTSATPDKVGPVLKINNPAEIAALLGNQILTVR
jgi:hypothetical protein